MSLEMVGVNNITENGTHTNQGLKYRYGFRVGMNPSDPESRGGLLLVAEAPASNSPGVLVEGDETIGFTVGTTTLTYDAGSPSSTTLVVRDNDVTAGPSVTSSQFVYETAPQRLQFTFNQDVGASLSMSDFNVSGPPGMPPHSLSYDSLTNTATLSFQGILPDGNYSAEAVAAGITNAAGQPLTSTVRRHFFFLNADANRDRRVNLADFNVLAANFGQSERTFSQANFNYDCIVNLQDFNILASRFGGVLPAVATVDQTGNRPPPGCLTTSRNCRNSHSRRGHPTCPAM